MPTGHAQRLAQLGGTRAEVAVGDARAPAPPPHRRQSLEGLEGTDQDGGGQPGALGHRIQTPVHPVGEIDVRGARALEQAGVAARTARAIAVRCGVIGAEVGFGLDDPAGGATASELAQENVSQKSTRDLGSRSRVERRRQCSASHVPPVSPRFTFDQNDSPPPSPPLSTSGSRAEGGGLGAGGGAGSALAVRGSGASRGSVRSPPTRSPRSPRPSAPAPRPRPPRPRPPRRPRLPRSLRSPRSDRSPRSPRSDRSPRSGRSRSSRPAPPSTPPPLLLPPRRPRPPRPRAVRSGGALSLPNCSGTAAAGGGEGSLGGTSSIRGLKFGSISTTPIFGISGGATRGPREPRRNRALRAGIPATGAFAGRMDGGADDSGIGGSSASSASVTAAGSAGGAGDGIASRNFTVYAPSSSFARSISSRSCAWRSSFCT